MSPEIRRVAIFGVLASILGGYAYVTTPEKKTISTDLTKKTDRPALEFSLDKVKQVDIVFEGKHLVCRHTPQGWMMPSSGTPVRQDAINDFLTFSRTCRNCSISAQLTPTRGNLPNLACARQSRALCWTLRERAFVFSP
jgi:hypothetical protein